MYFEKTKKESQSNSSISWTLCLPFLMMNSVRQEEKKRDFMWLTYESKTNSIYPSFVARDFTVNDWTSFVPTI